MPNGYTTVSASQLKDASGSLVANATIYFRPVSNSGTPISFRAGGASEGQTCSESVSALVTAGAFSVSLADTTLTSPVNVGYACTLIDNLTGGQLLSAGYGCVQPSGDAWSFDTYQPNLAAQVTVQYGAKGDKGDTGASGAPGTPGAPGISGSATPLTQGTVLIVEGDSIPAGYGSQNPYATIMVNTNPKFGSRVSYHNVATVGYTLEQMQGRYTSTVQPLIHAAVTAELPCLLVLDAGSNSLCAETAAVAYPVALSYWSQAKLDGATVYASTVRQRVGAISDTEREQIEVYNNLVRSAPAGSYDVLLDWDMFLPDPTNTTFYTFDGIHTSYAGDRAQAAFLASAILNGGTSTPACPVAPGEVRSLAYATGLFYPSLYTDVVMSLASSPAGVAPILTQEMTRQGKRVTLVNAGGACYLQATSPATVNGGGISPTLSAPGDSMTFQLDGTDWKIIANNVRSTNVRSFSAVTTNALLPTDSVVDCAGYAGPVFDGGQANQPGQVVTILNSGPGTVDSLASGTKVNGSALLHQLTLNAGQSIQAVFVSAAIGWVTSTPTGMRTLTGEDSLRALDHVIDLAGNILIFDPSGSIYSGQTVTLVNSASAAGGITTSSGTLVNGVGGASSITIPQYGSARATFISPTAGWSLSTGSGIGNGSGATGTMAVQNANAVAITGGTATLSSVTLADSSSPVALAVTHPNAEITQISLQGSTSTQVKLGVFGGDYSGLQIGETGNSAQLLYHQNSGTAGTLFLFVDTAGNGSADQAFTASSTVFNVTGDIVGQSNKKLVFNSDGTVTWTNA